MKTRALYSALHALLASVFLSVAAWPTLSHAAFTDVTGPAGLTSSNIARGAAWGDYDNDGCVDLYVDAATGGTLYKNNCNGTFTDVTGLAGIIIGGDQEWGSAWGDYDGDQDLDLYVSTGSGPNILYRNNGNGTFTNVAAAAGVDDRRGSAGVSWVDFDIDGNLDLFVANRFTGGNRADALYRNNGNGTFTDVAVSAGVAGDSNRQSFMGVWFDYDNDRDMDLYLSVDFGNDTLYRNNGNGTFSDVSLAAGITDPQHGMGITVGDINNDGCMDVLSTNNTQGDPSDVEHNTSALYLNNCNSTFTRVSEAIGILDRAVVEWGANLVDYDNDMDLDLSIVAGGMLSNGQPNVFYENSGSCNASLFDITTNSGTDNSGAAFSSIWADYDNDGDLDWFIANEHGSNALMRNDGATGNHLKVKLFGAGANTHGIGAIIKVTAGGIVQSRVVQAGTSYASAEESLGFFGLGVKAAADRVTVLWPAGSQTDLTNVSAGTLQVSESGATPPPPPPPPAAGAIVQGTVFNPSGLPEEQVTVKLYDSGAALEVDTTLSDVAGQYSLAAPAGTYELQAEKPGSGLTNVSLSVTLADGEVRVQDLTLGGSTPPPPGSGEAVVTGTTRNPLGAAEGNVNVRLTDKTTGQVVSTVSDTSGQYSLTAAAGEYQLQAAKRNSGYRNATIIVNLTAGETLNQDISLRQ